MKLITPDRIATGVVAIHEDGRVCVVSSLKGPYLVLPKGGLEPHLTQRENAIKELQEEAGLDCWSVPGLPIADIMVDYPPQGEYTGKLQREVYYLGLGPVEVEWEEESLRERHWLTLEEAESKVHPVQYTIIKAAYEARERHY